MNYGIPPLFTVPNEIIYEIAKCLPRNDVISLHKTCHALHLPLRSFIISKNKNDILLFAAQRSHLTLLSIALSAGADITYRGKTAQYFFRYSDDTALHYAAAGGNTAIIAELLRYNPPLNDRGDSAESPLFSAAWRGHQASVNLLLSAGCDPTALSLSHGKATLLIAAIRSNLEPTARAYIHQMDARALDEAIKLKRLDITKLMFEHGIARTVSPPLHLAAAAGLEYVKLCLAHGARINVVPGHVKCTALSIAVARGNTDVINYLLSQGADPNAGPKKYRPIMSAVYHPDKANVQKLLRHGADLTVLQNPHADVLVSACVRSPPGLVAVLLDAGQGLVVDGNCTDQGKLTPLHVAAKNGNTGVIKLLLQRGAMVDVRRGRNMETPLHLAARAAMNPAVEALLEGGADPHLKCNGITALKMANRSSAPRMGRAFTMAALVNGGANINELGAKSRSVVNNVLEEEKEKKQKLKGRKAKK